MCGGILDRSPLLASLQSSLYRPNSSLAHQAPFSFVQIQQWPMGQSIVSQRVVGLDPFQIDRGTGKQVVVDNGMEAAHVQC